MSRSEKLEEPVSEPPEATPFEYLPNPGTQIRQRRRMDLKSVGADADELREQQFSADSYVERYEFIFERMWYIGHIFVMTMSILSMILCLTRQVKKPIPRLIYRSTFLGAVITYTISLLQNLNGATPNFFALLPLETFQSIILASLWTVTTPHTIKLVSFALYSLLHVADSASEHHSGSKHRRKIANKLSDELAPQVINSIGYLDLWLFVELARDCLLIRPGAVVSIVVFSFFFRVKLMTAPVINDSFMNVYHHIDHYMVDHRTAKGPRELWIRFRNKIEPEGVNHSELYQKDTNEAIELANIYNSLDD